MENGKIVLVNYTGKITASNEIFETTDEKKAVEAGIFEEGRKYTAMPIVIGSGDMLKQVETALEKMKTGETKKITLQPEQAFGARKAELIKIVPLAEFKKRDVNPVPGLVIDLNNARGKVQAVSGGRVRVDFNSPLAGKEIEYEVKIEKELRNNNEKIEAFFEKFFGVLPEKERKLSIKEGKIEVALDAKYTQAVAPVKKVFSDTIMKNVKGITSVKFTEEFSAEEKSPKKKETKKAKK